MVFLRSIGLFALLSLGTASAAVVWNNGTPVADVNNQNGSIMSDTNQADDFQLLVTTDLTAIRFWSTEFTAADRLPLIFWQILSDAPGTPGSVIASGSAAPTITAAGTNAGSPQFQNDFNISVLGLAAGTYWLALHNGSYTDINNPTNGVPYDYYWSWTDQSNPTTNTGQGSFLPSDPWIGTSAENAFVVFGDAVGTPEPAALLLTSVGIGALALLRRRRA